MQVLPSLRTKLIQFTQFPLRWQLRRIILLHTKENIEMCQQYFHKSGSFRMFSWASAADRYLSPEYACVKHGSSARTVVSKKLRARHNDVDLQRSYHRAAVGPNQQEYIFSNLFQRNLESLGNINYVSVRNKKRNLGEKKTDNAEPEGEESDDEEEDPELSGEDSSDDEGEFSRLFDGDDELPNNYRELKTYVKSLRMDAIVSAGLNIPRNKVEDYFLESKLRHNGEKVLKKSKQLAVGDYIDLVTEVQESSIKLKRVRIVDISKEKSRKDRHAVFLRAWRGNVTLTKPDSL